MAKSQPESGAVAPVLTRHVGTDGKRTLTVPAAANKFRGIPALGVGAIFATTGLKQMWAKPIPTHERPSFHVAVMPASFATTSHPD